VVICLEQGADLRVAQLMPLPLTVSCFSKIQIGFTFLVQAHPGSPGKRAVKRVCVCVCELHIIQLLLFFSFIIYISYISLSELIRLGQILSVLFFVRFVIICSIPVITT